MKEPLETSVFKKMYLDWTYGIDKIYSQADIDKIRNSTSFNREFALKFEPEYGNVYSLESINRAIELGKKYKPSLNNVNKQARHVIGVDPGFGPSEFGLCLLEYSDSIIKVLYADSFDRIDFDDMVYKIWEIKSHVGNLNNVFIDGANTEFVSAVKKTLGENSDWYYIHDRIDWAKSKGLDIAEYMQVVPVNFAQEGASMLVRSKELLDDPSGLVSIHPDNEKFITALKSAVAVEYKLKKEDSVYNDILDSYRLACKYFTPKRKRRE
jgi:hypothetical protein